MNAVASTNAGLFRQLVAAGWNADDLALARRAYDLARALVSGLVNGDGRPFLNHLVSLASLLQHYGRPPTTVAAGLLHSIYAHGDFGVLCSFPQAQARVRTVSTSVEELVRAFHALPWNAETLPLHAAGLAAADAVRRETILIRVVNELEHLVDGAALHRHDADRYLAARADRLPTFAALANGLGLPELARDLEVALRATNARSRPIDLREQAATPWVILPASARPSWLARLAPRRPDGTAVRLRRWPRRGG